MDSHKCFAISKKRWWTWGDSAPRPPACKALPADVFEEEPPFSDLGHEEFIARLILCTERDSLAGHFVVSQRAPAGEALSITAMMLRSVRSGGSVGQVSSGESGPLSKPP